MSHSVTRCKKIGSADVSFVLRLSSIWASQKKKTKSHARVIFATGAIALNLGLWSDIAHVITCAKFCDSHC